MSVRLDQTNQNIECNGISVDVHSQRMETDDAAKANSFSKCLWWHCEEDVNDDVERGIFESNVSSTRAHGFTVRAVAGVYTFRWYIGSTVVATCAVAESLLNKTVNVFYSFRRAGVFAESDVQIIVKVRGGGEYLGAVAAGVTGISVGTPTHWVLGGKRHVAVSAKGTAIVFVRTDVVRDGSGGSTDYRLITGYDDPIGAFRQDVDSPDVRNVTLIAQTGVPTVTVTCAGHGLLAGMVGCKFAGTNSTPAINGLGASSKGIITVVDADRFTFVHSANVTGNGSAGTITIPRVVLGLNHIGGSNIFSSAAADGRKGAAVTNNCLCGMDRGNASFPTYFGRGVVQTLTIAGTPSCVNPYDFSGQTPPRMERNNSDASALTPVDLTYEPGPFGRLGLAAREAAAVWGGAAPTRKVRLMVTANSRNGYRSYAQVRSRNGTFRGVNAHNGYNESGILEQDNFWPHVVGVWHAAPPSGFGGLTPSMTSSIPEATQAEEATFGFRCNAAAGYPVILNNAGSAAGGTPALAMIAGTYRTIDTSVSRFWVSSRLAAISGANTTYFSLGPAAVRGIFAGYSYRIMCSPEHTMPAADPLVIRAVVINFPSSSAVQRVTRKATASTQDGADTLSAADEAGVPTLGSAFTPLAVTATAGTYAENNLGVPTGRNSVTVDDTGNTVAPFVAGDLVELLTNGGAAPTSGYPSQSRPDLSVIYSITGKGTSTCVVTLDHPFTTTITAGGGTPSKVAFMDAREVYKTITVRFAAAEVADGSWRGIEIKASNDGKSGILLASLACENTAVDGILIGNLGWPGMGYRYWERMAKVIHERDGKTMFRRIMDLLAPDVVMISQANQGVSTGTYYQIQRNWYDTLRGMLPAGVDIIHAQGGPEIAGDASADYSGSTAPANSHLTMEYTSQLVGCPMVSQVWNPEAPDALGRYVMAQSAAEDTVHPRSDDDVAGWFGQLGELVEDEEAEAGAGWVRLPR